MAHKKIQIEYKQKQKQESNRDYVLFTFLLFSKTGYFFILNQRSPVALSTYTILSLSS